jgi:hypothetical protein
MHEALRHSPQVIGSPHILPWLRLGCSFIFPFSIHFRGMVFKDIGNSFSVSPFFAKTGN